MDLNHLVWQRRALAAYGWPATLTDGEILARLVALNAERAAEEAQGKIRWLRPEFQNPEGSKQEQGELAVDEGSRTSNSQQPTPLEGVLKVVDESIGVLVLNDRHNISTVREASSQKAHVEPAAIFDSLCGPAQGIACSRHRQG